MNDKKSKLSLNDLERHLWGAAYPPLGQRRYGMKHEKYEIEQGKKTISGLSG
jgi:hypothetical protein